MIARTASSTDSASPRISTVSLELGLDSRTEDRGGRPRSRRRASRLIGPPRSMVSSTSVPSPGSLRISARPPCRFMRPIIDSRMPRRSSGTASGSKPGPRSSMNTRASPSLDLGVEPDRAAVGGELGGVGERLARRRDRRASRPLVERRVADDDRPRSGRRADSSTSTAAVSQRIGEPLVRACAAARPRATSAAPVSCLRASFATSSGSSARFCTARASGGPSHGGGQPPPRAPGSGRARLAPRRARLAIDHQNGAEIRTSAIVTTKAASAALPADSSTPFAQKKNSAAPRTTAAANPPGRPEGLALQGRRGEVLLRRRPGKAPGRDTRRPTALVTGRASRSGEQPRPRLQVDHSPVLEEQNDAEGQDEIPAPSALESGLLTVGGSPPADLPLGVLFLLVVVVVDATGVDLIGRLVRDQHLPELDVGVQLERRSIGER